MFDAIIQVVRALVAGLFPAASEFWPFIEMVLRQIAPEIKGGEDAEKVGAIVAEYLSKYNSLYAQNGSVSQSVKAELFYELTVALHRAVGLRGV